MQQILCTVIMFFLLGSSAYAGNVSKAQDFIKAGMYPQAIELLDKEIHENPANAEAHFELGSCYVIQGRYGDADARFASAVRLKSDYGYKIGSIYKSAGLSAVDKGQTNDAITLLNKAITYQTDLTNGLVSDMMGKGKAAVQQGKYDNADAQFLIATSLESSRKKEVCDMYGQLGDSASGEKSVGFYSRASQYCNSYNGKAGNTYLELAKKMARTPGKDKERDMYKEKAAKYVGSNVVEQEVPEFREFGAGEYVIGPLKAGEQTPYWIAFLRGDYDYVITSPDDKFTLTYNDGSPAINAWAVDSFPHKENIRFKIIAVTDQPNMKLKVKNKSR